MSEPTLKQFMDELIHQLQSHGDLTLTRWRLADMLVSSYEAAECKAEATRRLLTKHSEKGSLT